MVVGELRARAMSADIVPPNVQSPAIADLRVAVLVPCYNEEAAIGQVVASFRTVLPDADIYVYDNNSRDRTIEVARAAGAIVRREPLQGKGNVVRRMFADIEADVFVLVDGDATYDAQSAPAMIAKLHDENLDMVVGVRRSQEQEAYRSGHRLGNRLLTGTVAHLFGKHISDMLSGYRVMSRRFVKSFPALSAGFETETELTVHALALRLPVSEVDTPYYSRGEGSTSKLNTYRDGFRIGLMILRLCKEERPILFFVSIAAVLACAATILTYPLAVTYYQTGLVPRLPTAVLVAALMIMSVLSLTSGAILSSVTRARRETRRLAYLALRASGAIGRERRAAVTPPAGRSRASGAGSGD